LNVLKFGCVAYQIKNVCLDHVPLEVIVEVLHRLMGNVIETSYSAVIRRSELPQSGIEPHHLSIFQRYGCVKKLAFEILKELLRFLKTPT
jgi:hypothetical protein